MEVKLPNVHELMDKSIPDLLWVVNDFLPEGLSLLAAKPKSGKSWLALQLCFSIALGMDFLNKFGTIQGQVIYLALEDSERRLKSRMQRVMASMGIDQMPRNFHYQTEFPLMEKCGLIALKALLANTKGLKLIVIDTMNKFAPPKDKASDIYAESYRYLSMIHELTKEYQMSILLIHHTRKDAESDSPFDTILGSVGIAGCVDSMYVLTRQGQSNVLHVKGRDVQEMELAMNFNKDTCLWEYLGDPRVLKLSEERQHIISMLKLGQALSPKQIAYSLGMSYGSMRVILPKMVSDGSLYQPRPGVYAVSIP